APASLCQSPCSSFIHPGADIAPRGVRPCRLASRGVLLGLERSHELLELGAVSVDEVLLGPVQRLHLALLDVAVLRAAEVGGRDRALLLTERLAHLNGRLLTLLPVRLELGVDELLGGARVRETRVPRVRHARGPPGPRLGDLRVVLEPLVDEVHLLEQTLVLLVLPDVAVRTEHLFARLAVPPGIRGVVLPLAREHLLLG